MKKPVLLVTGSEGQLGSEIKLLANHYSGYAFLFIDKEDLDLTDESAFVEYANLHQPDYIINCAAFTAVDLAEKENEVATKVNADVPAMLATYCRANDTRLIHISTDYVFDGNGNIPVSEEHLPNPLSVYGVTKLNGEKRVLEILPNAYLIRTSWVYSVFGKNFLKTMLSLGKQRQELNVVVDQVGTPTCARDLADAILKVIQSIDQGIDVPGIYHYSNEGVTSWYDFATEIMKMANLNCSVSPISASEYPTAAKRPVFSVLNKSKIKKTFNLNIPHWRQSLEKTLNELTT